MQRQPGPKSLRLILSSTLAVLVFLCMSAALGETPLQNSQAEARAQNLFHEIRCVVCQHESIATSNADMAADMRRFVRHKIEDGQTDRQIKQELHTRFGDFVLFQPPFHKGTFLLWTLPFLAFLVAGTAVWLYFRQMRKTATERERP